MSRFLPGLLLMACLGTGLQAQRDAPDIALQLDFDTVLQLPGLWEMTQDRLEETFKEERMTESPYFKWLTVSRDSARFARRPYTNVTVDMTVFKGRIPVEEAVVEFKDGRVSQIYLSLYNRGDSGKISAEDFDARFKMAGQSLIEKLGSRPVERKPSTQTAVKTTGWFWTSPHSLALLEYNADAMAQRGGPEFLRLKITPPTAREQLLNIAAIGQSTTTRSRSELPQFVKKEPGGDVFVSGIPMVDQGDKGYCVVASCQRLFGYLNIPADQHELAQVAGSNAESGTNSLAFTEALGRIDNRFKVRFKPLLEKHPMRQSDDRNARPDRFAKMIQDHIDRGVPLLWGLVLGLFPEEPDIAMQTGGAHMRLIIGYNVEKEELLFSDSWGAGHEMKRMKVADAVQATFGVYLIEPRAR